jgi:hypothetical protein
MIMSRFRSMGLAAGAAASVLSCYMVSLRVARERGEVERIQQQIADTRDDIRALQTELGTRGRMRQLERWNSDVLALSAPGAAQYLNGVVELAAYQPVTAPKVDAGTAMAAAAPAKVLPVAQANSDSGPAKAVPAVEVKAAAPDLPRLVHASYKPESRAKSGGPNAGLIHTASYVTLRSEKVTALSKRAVAPSKKVAVHSEKIATHNEKIAMHNEKTHSDKAAAPSDKATARSERVKTRSEKSTRVALLDDHALLGDIGRAAAHEAKTGHKADQ